MAPLWTEPIKKIASHNNYFFNRLPEKKIKEPNLQTVQHFGPIASPRAPGGQGQNKQRRAKKKQGRGQKKHFKKFKIILKFAPDEKNIFLIVSRPRFF